MTAPTGDAREWLGPEAVPGQRPGDSYVRVRRNHLEGFGRGHDHLVAAPDRDGRRGPVVRALAAGGRFLVGTVIIAALALIRGARGGRSPDSMPRSEAGSVLVPVSGPGPATEAALAYAHRLSHRPQTIPLLGRRHSGFLRELDGLCAADPRSCVTVILPAGAQSLEHELVHHPGLVWLKLQLLARPEVVVASMPAAAGSGGPPVTRTSRLIGLVPLVRIDPASIRALNYALQLMDQVVAVHVAESEPSQLRAEFDQWVERQVAPDRLSLVVIESATRTVSRPLLHFFRSWRQAHPDCLCTVVLPEGLGGGPWASLLHHHRAFWLKTALLTESSLAVADVTAW